MEDEKVWEDIWEESGGFEDQGFEQEFVMGFEEGQARAQVGGRMMATEIEGGGRLARLQELQQKRDPSAKHELKFMETYSKIKRQTNYDFGQDAEETLKTTFLGLRHSLYKDPALFLFASIALYSAAGKITKRGLDEAKRISRLTEEYSFLTEDLIRYCRLLGAAV